MKTLLENLQKSKIQYQEAKKECDAILDYYREQERQAELALDEVFYSKKLYLPLSKLREYKGKNITSLRLPTALHRCAVLSDVFVNNDNELESGDYDVRNRGYLGFYDMYIDGELVEETSREYLCKKEILKESINQIGRT